MTEVWRDIVDYEGKYQVSNHGRVRNIKFIESPRSKKKERILTPKEDRGGYLRVHLSNGKSDFHPTLHRLVATAFLDNPLCLPQVNHKDENKRNNHVSNLEWCSPIYNTQYGTGQQRASESKKKKIYQIDKFSNQIVKEYTSATDAAIELFGDKKKKNAITSCARGTIPTAFGFIWRYTKESDKQCQPG